MSTDALIIVYFHFSHNKKTKTDMPKILPIYLAPLQGYTEAPYRNAHSACFGGVDAYYTPFVRLEHGAFRSKDLREINPSNNDVTRLIPQLIAPEPTKAEKIVTLFIEKGYHEVDINLGCPFPILAKRHNGSGILPYPKEVESLLSIVTKYPDIHFSVKMRLGWERPEESLALLPILNDLPIEQITMHPRLGKQQYKGEVDMDGFAAFYEKCKHPLVYNGDLLTADDIHLLSEQFPQLNGVMIGRGLLANPALAIEYKENRSLSPDEMRKKLTELHNRLLSHYEIQMEGGEIQILNKMKSFWEYLLPNADKKLLKAVHKSSNLNKYKVAVNTLLINFV